MSVADLLGEGRERWTLVGLWLLTAAAAAYEIVPASVTPTIIDDLGVGPAAASLLVGVMFGTAVVLSVPTGVVLDRVDRRAGIAVATAALVVAGVAGHRTAAAGAYWPLVASRVLGALAFVFIWNAGLAVLGSVAADARRATALGVYTAAGPAGFALGQFGGPVVAASVGWPAVFAAPAPLAVVGAAVFLLATRGTDLAARAGSAPDLAGVGRVLADARVWLVCVLSFLTYSLYLLVNTWMPGYLTESVGLAAGASGLLVALFPAMGAVSRTTGGVLSDRLFAGRRRPVAVLAFAAMVPIVAGLGLVRVPVALVPLLLAGGFFVQLAQGLLYTYVREVADPGFDGTATAMMTAVGLFGALVAPVAAGVLIEWTGAFAPVFWLAFGAAVLGVGLARLAPEPGG